MENEAYRISVQGGDFQLPLDLRATLLRRDYAVAAERQRARSLAGHLPSKCTERA